jgi:ABC-2 type transport system ATP-binding protein
LQEARVIIFDKVNKFVLRDVDLHVPKGITLGIIGASGAGKTTFLKLISGLLLPESGFVRTGRRDPVEKGDEVARRISVLFADIPVFDENLSIIDCLEEIRIMYKISQKDFDQRLKNLSERLGFSEFLNSKSKTLSLGQKRRCELGLTFLSDADLYIFDEPCIGLDQNGKASFYKLVEEKKLAGKTILVSSHSMQDISAIADRVLVLTNGQATFYGSQEELYKRLAPMEESLVELDGQLPDISDLEVENYSVENGRIKIRYNSNHVSSKEVLERICATSKIKSLSVRKADLAESIKSLNTGRK